MSESSSLPVEIELSPSNASHLIRLTWYLFMILMRIALTNDKHILIVMCAAPFLKSQIKTLAYFLNYLFILYVLCLLRHIYM